MKKTLVAFHALVLTCSITAAQEKSYQQPATLGIHFTFTDFETAAAIRNTSLSTVLREKQYGKLKNMSQGLAISYARGLSEHFDFSSTLAGAFLSYPVPGQSSPGGQSLLLEADASVRGKMLSDKYWFVPYLQTGVGISKYEGYWGAFIPAGLGIQISFFGEAYLQISTQYRIAVSESSSNHFLHSVGLVGNIGKKED